MTSSVTAWVKRHQLISFFSAAYAITTLAFGTWILFPALPYAPFWFVGIFSPTIAALLVAGILGGRAEIMRLLSGFTRWRIGWKWFLACTVFVTLPLILVVVSIALGNNPPGPTTELTVAFIAGQLLFTVLSGPLAEEAGWRGFALPRLETRHGALAASLVLGTLWAFWHVPQYFIPNNGMIPFPIFIPICIALSIIFTWIYNNTGGSLVATVLAHFSFNFSGAWIAGHLGLLPPMALYIGGGVFALILVIVIVAFEGPRNLSRLSVDRLPFRRIESVPAQA